MAISTIENSVVHFDALANSLADAGKGLRGATLSLRAAFTTADSTNADFRNLRRAIVDDSNIYRFQVLPVAKQSTEHVKQFMDYFMTLPFEDILDIADELSEDASDGQKLMTICKDIHVAVCANFKRHQDDITKALSKCQLQKEHYEKQAKAFREKAATQDNWAFGLCFVPGINLVATPILLTCSGHNEIRSSAAVEEAQLAVNAMFVIRDCLTGAVDKYVNAMGIFASTFQLLANEIEAFLKNLEKYKDTEKKQFYTMMKSNAQKLITACQQYQAVTLDAETDLQVLPLSDNPNYVQTWLADQGLDGGPPFKERLRRLGKSLPKALTNLVE